MKQWYLFRVICLVVPPPSHVGGAAHARCSASCMCLLDGGSRKRNIWRRWHQGPVHLDLNTTHPRWDTDALISSKESGAAWPSHGCWRLVKAPRMDAQKESHPRGFFTPVLIHSPIVIVMGKRWSLGVLEDAETTEVPGTRVSLTWI